MNKKTIRFYYKREGAFIYLAHLDFMRVWERALRRSGLKIAYSQGFNPRPAITFALPAGVGVAVDYDPLEMTFEENILPEEAADRLNLSLPQEIRILAAFEIGSRKKSLMGLVEAARYRFSNKGLGKLAFKFDSMDSLQAEIYKPKIRRHVSEDILPLLLSLESFGQDDLVGVFSAGSKNNLRPDVFLKALGKLFNLDETYLADTLILREEVILTEVSGQSATK